MLPSTEIDTSIPGEVPRRFVHDERVQLPDRVKRIVEARADAVGFPALKRAAAEMSNAYREGRAGSLKRLGAAERTAAYLVTRMPATYAATSAALGEIDGRAIGSVLDVGAGTGAASLAVRQRYPEASITMIERDSAFAEAAREVVPDAKIVAADIAQMTQFPEHDLVIAAYSLGELAGPVAQRLWKAARVALVVIEPGSPAGFGVVRWVRDQLLAEGARMLAPCPAESACPMAGAEWCDFGARVERSSLHRRVKGAELNYEDEKFSYVALGRETGSLPAHRIIEHPVHTPGLIVLRTCTSGGFERVAVTKRSKEEYRAARKAGWGGRW